MNTTIIICSVNRPSILHETVLGLLRQTVLPESIILSLCDDGSVLMETKALPALHCVFGRQGSSAQRNTGIPLARTPYVLFLDDDVELAPDYIEQMERVFADDPLIVAATGGVVADGAEDTKEIEREDAVRRILEYRGSRACVDTTVFCGFNIFVRCDVLRSERFDECLPLYGWLEDRDFLHRCRKHGKIVRNQGALIAHLATRAGRTSDIRLGYSKIANPWYLWRKSVIMSLPELVVIYWVKTTIANIIRVIMPKHPQSPDYKKRLMGNLMAYRDLILFRIDPQNILNIPDSTIMPGQAQRREEVLRSAPTR